MFLHDGFAPYVEKAVEFCKEYNKELAALMNQYGIENEGDIACGCLNTVSFNNLRGACTRKFVLCNCLL